MLLFLPSCHTVAAGPSIQLLYACISAWPSIGLEVVSSEQCVHLHMCKIIFVVAEDGSP